MRCAWSIRAGSYQSSVAPLLHLSERHSCGLCSCVRRLCARRPCEPRLARCSCALRTSGHPASVHPLRTSPCRRSGPPCPPSAHRSCRDGDPIPRCARTDAPACFLFFRHVVAYASFAKRARSGRERSKLRALDGGIIFLPRWTVVEDRRVALYEYASFARGVRSAPRRSGWIACVGSRMISGRETREPRGGP